MAKLVLSWLTVGVPKLRPTKASTPDFGVGALLFLTLVTCHDAQSTFEIHWQILSSERDQAWRHLRVYRDCPHSA